jgi:transposase
MQVKVLGAERRRRWSYDEKVRLVEETLRPGETVCGVARRNGVAQSLLFTWRRQARQGRLGGEAVPALVPVDIVAAPAPVTTCAPQPTVPFSPPVQRTRAGIIEIELGGCRVRVDRDVDGEALQRVLELLRRR